MKENIAQNIDCLNNRTQMRCISVWSDTTNVIELFLLVECVTRNRSKIRREIGINEDGYQDDNPDRQTCGRLLQLRMHTHLYVQILRGTAGCYRSHSFSLSFSGETQIEVRISLCVERGRVLWSAMTRRVLQTTPGRRQRRSRRSIHTSNPNRTGFT